MAFKNAFKIIINRFSLVWVLALYMAVLTAIIVAISLPFFLSMRRAVINAGISEQFYNLYQGVLSGETLENLFIQMRVIVDDIENLFKTDKLFSLNSGLLLFGVGFFTTRFLLGFYELPLLTVLDGSMSSNAKVGFMGAFISRLGKSSRFVLVKMLYTLFFDMLIYFAFYFMSYMFKVPVLSVFAPFLIMLVLIAMLALRYSLICMWSPAVAVGEKTVFKALKFSLRRTAKFFKQIYTIFVVTWIVAITLNLFIGIFTLGAGLIVTVPFTMLFICILNMTIFFGKNNKRYYIDGETIVTPPLFD